MISFSSETIRQYQNQMSDVCVFGDVSQWQHVINLVTHPVSNYPVHGPVIHEAEFQTALTLWNKMCPPDKTAENLFVNRGQNPSPQNLLFKPRILLINLIFKSHGLNFKKGTFKYDTLFVKLSPRLQPYNKEQSNKKKKKKRKPSEMQRQEGHTAVGVSWQLVQSCLR